MDIILASRSKRRSSILLSCGIRHRVIASNVKEDMKGRLPSLIAMKNARLKAEDVANRIKSGYVIGADTVVRLRKKVIGKPLNARSARNMLRDMSGRAVSVYTGLCIIDAKKEKRIVDYEKSEVRVKKIKESEIPGYFKLLGPYDKAGGFSIEGVGSFIFDDIRGSYFNVLGLPTMKLKDMFESLGFDLLKIIRN